MLEIRVSCPKNAIKRIVFEETNFSNKIKDRNSKK